MKLIIIEGPDNCGKNTLINKLSENFLTITNIHYKKPENKLKDVEIVMEKSKKYSDKYVNIYHKIID